MSYPFIWEDEKGVHICAETCAKQSIYSYLAMGFPHKWEKEGVFLEGKKYVDSTILFSEDKTKQYCFTYVVEGINCGTLYRYQWRNNKFDKDTEQIISRDSSLSRPGGAFFREEGELYRVAQDCSTSYGKNLVFCKILQNNEVYKETVEKKVESKFFTAVNNCIGIHTYNRSCSYEVIDFRVNECNLVGLFGFHFRMLGRKLRVIFQKNKRK